jgi:LiaI-LiaF-like transmembrane region
MNGSEIPLARTLRGPVTLITLGILFALNNFTPYGFGQTWPVLLIVFGLFSLLGRGNEPPAQAPYPPRPWNYQQQPPPPGGYRSSSYTGTTASGAPQQPVEPGPAPTPGESR